MTMENILKKLYTCGERKYYEELYDLELTFSTRPLQAEIAISISSWLHVHDSHSNVKDLSEGVMGKKLLP